MPTMAKKKKPTPQPILDQLDQADIEVNELIKSGLQIEETCYAIDLEVSWFGGSAAAKGAVAEDMVNAAEAEKDAVSISTRLFSCKHPAVEKCEAAKRALYAFRDMRTFPLAKVNALLSTDTSATIISSGNAAGTGKRMVAKDAGIRVIPRERLDDFIKQVKEIYGPAVMQAVQALNDQLPQILEFEQKRQGRLFRKENYPQEVHASIRIQPRRIGLGIDFEKHCPEAAKALKANAQKQLTDTVELATADFVDNFLSVVKTVTNQLGYRTRVRPDATDATFGYLRDAEVISLVTPKEDPTLKLGQIRVELRYTPAGEKKSKLQELELPEATYHKFLKPYRTEERKKVVESSLEGFYWQLERFREIAEHLGPAGAKLEGIVQQARDMFSKAGSNMDQVLKEMRESKFCRDAACEELNHVKDVLQDMLVSLPAYKGRRRAVNVDAED